MWGNPAAGLRLGLSINGKLPERALRVTLKNMGSTELDVYLAFGAMNRFVFVATAPDGKEYPITDRKVSCLPV
jgi:hypothetical protein